MSDTFDKYHSHRDFSKEFIFSTSRSSGAGGQHVNKVETKVELRFNIGASKLLTETEKSILFKKLKNNINSQEELILVSQSERSQVRNKDKVIVKFYALLNWALLPVKKRVPTRPTFASKKRRLEHKQKHAQKKANRRFNID